jgi:hypothetical protein
VVRAFAEGVNIDIAIVGGGATGVELAAELSRMVELAAGYGKGDIRGRLRLTLLESAPRILGAFPEAVSTSATSQLRKLGVDVRTGVKVVAADTGGYLLEGSERAHGGIKAAVAKVLNASWQRCRVHFIRNALAHAGKRPAHGFGIHRHRVPPRTMQRADRETVGRIGTGATRSPLRTPPYNVQISRNPSRPRPPTIPQRFDLLTP